MRVLHIISGADNGGAKTHLLNLCSSSNTLFENIIGCINKGVLYEEAKRIGIECVEFKQKSRFDLSIGKEILNYVSGNNIDIVNFHGANANFIYMSIKNKLNKPAVTTIHSDYRYDFINSRIKHICFTPLNIFALRKFDNYICVSEKIKKLLDRKNFSGNKFVVNNGISRDVNLLYDRDIIRKENNINEEDFVFTMVARFHPIKNHLGLIEAFSMLKKDYDRVKLLLVGGDGGFLNTVKEEVKRMDLESSVIFAGLRSNPIDYINASEINILTSLNETFPIVILEGAIVNKTAICSDVGDMDRIIKEGTGFIINPNSVDDIYSKMKFAYSNREVLSQMGKDLHDCVMENYSMDKFYLRYYNSYVNILKGDVND